MVEERMTEARYAELNNKNDWTHADSVAAVLEIHRSWCEIFALKASADELQRQRDSTNESWEVLKEENERLRAELASLKPSGQVAEDVAHVLRVLKDPIFIRQTGPEFRAALSRLAALAAKALPVMESQATGYKERAEMAERELAAIHARARAEVNTHGKDSALGGLISRIIVGDTTDGT